MAQLKHMILGLTSMVLAPTFSIAQSYTSNGIGLAIMNLNAATLKGQANTTNDIWGRIRQDFRMTEVNPEIIRKHETYYSSHSAYFNRTIVRSQPYLYHIVSEAEKRQMPAEIALLPFIESAFVNKAKSPVGASGLWQFMPSSGRQYGLEQTNLYDERHDVYAATDAALTYLQYLYSLFGDWSLALAAYNWGEGNVGKAVKRAQLAGIDPTYENLRMPNETRNYVPKLLAVRNIIDNPQAFGLNLVSVPNRPYFEAISIDQPIDIDAAARLANISTAEFLTLNPSFKSPVFIPKENRKMLLPTTAVRTFEKNYRNADKATLLSWNIYKSYTPTNILDLAAQTGMSTAEIKRLNNISSNTIPAGRSLLISKNTINTQDINSFKSTDSDPLLNIAKSQPVSATDRLITQTKTDIITAENKSINTINQTTTTQTTSTPLNLAQHQTKTITTEKIVSTTSNIATAATQDSISTPTALETNNTNDALALLAQERNLQSTAAAAVQRALAETERENTQLRVATNTRSEKSPTRAQTTIADNRNESHKVVAGDTLFSIAQRYHINVADLVTANNLRGHNIQTGQILKVAINTSKNSNIVSVARKGSKTNNRIIPASYTVKKGDTLSSIAQSLKIPVSKLQKEHGKQILRPGQKLKLTNL